MSPRPPLLSAPAARWLAAPLTLLSAALLGSCAGMREWGGTDSPSGSVTLFAVQVPADADVDGHLPPDLRLQPGEVVRSQSCSITRGGQFAFTRTIEAEVGHLGAELDTLSPAAAEALGLEPYAGVLVRSVESDGPAGRAGLGPEDVILRYGDEAVRSFERLLYLVEKSAPGTPVEVEIDRGGKRIITSVVVGAAAQIVRSRTIQRDLPVIDDMDRTGLKLVEIPPDLRSLAGPGRLSPAGLLVVDVMAGGPAFFSKLRTRDFLLSVGDRFVSTIAEYRAAVGSFPRGARVKVVGWRDEERIETSLRISADASAESGFNIAGLVEYRGRPAGKRFRLLWGCLYHFSNHHSIREADSRSEHRTETHWGLVLSLLSYHGEPHRKTLRIAWLFPISFGA
ncbi:MAG: PDZ domain-containing protein [Planctomycetes bacterium]|nr:PDZ domain-containing protein [Planctomycetota bacterium]